MGSSEGRLAHDTFIFIRMGIGIPCHAHMLKFKSAEIINISVNNIETIGLKLCLKYTTSKKLND